MKSKKLYSDIADALVEHGYIVIENALSSNLSEKLLQNIDEDLFKNAGISSKSDRHLDKSRRRDKIEWLNENEPSQKEFLNFIKNLQEFLNRELYLGLTYYEAHFAIYDDGDFYEKHLDAFKNYKNRVVTTVYYLNDNWNLDDGGELIIYNSKEEKIKTVIPKADTLVLFLSEKFPHEVKVANKKRYSIAGWFRVDKI